MATKFEDLCRAYATSRQKYFDYRRSCHEFAQWLVKGLGDYFQCPMERLKYIPLKGEIKPGTYTLMGAMHLEDDAFWHLGVGISLYEKPNRYPQETVLLPILIKQEEGCFIVKIGVTNREFKVHKDNFEEIEPIYDTIYQLIKEDYEKELQRFLEKERTSRRIGF